MATNTLSLPDATRKMAAPTPEWVSIPRGTGHLPGPSTVRVDVLVRLRAALGRRWRRLGSRRARRAVNRRLRVHPDCARLGRLRLRQDQCQDAVLEGRLRLIRLHLVWQGEHALHHTV